MELQAENDAASGVVIGDSAGIAAFEAELSSMVEFTGASAERRLLVQLPQARICSAVPR
jgi:hypothetical protein